MKLLVMSSVGDLYVGLGNIVRRFGASGSLDYSFSQGDSRGVLDLLILSTCERFVYGAFTDKTVVCWDIDTASVQGSIKVTKRLTSMIYRAMDLLLPGKVAHSFTNSLARSFTHSFIIGANKGVLIASDKAGDVWAIDTPFSRFLFKVPLNYN